MKKFIFSLFLIFLFNNISCQSSGVVKRWFREAKVLEFLPHNRIKIKEWKGVKIIKLIGVDLPSKRKVENWKRNMPDNYKKEIDVIAKEAVDFLQKHISIGDVVYVEHGFLKKDRFGNELVFLYSNLKMINEAYIQAGYNLPYMAPDNSKYKKRFYNAIQYSMDNKKGFWKIWKNMDLSRFKYVKPKSYSSFPESAYKNKMKKTFTLMSFNVENLFDLKHDAGKSDFQYQPKTKKNLRVHEKIYGKMRKRGKHEYLGVDWSEKVLMKKMNRLAGAILNGDIKNGADIIIFQEVENFGVLERFRKEYLEKYGYYSIVLIEGKDFRGIDLAMVSKFPLIGKPVLHEIPFNPMKSSRDILEARFKLPDGSEIIALGLHFPSQASKIKFRIQAMKFLNKLKQSYPSGSMVVAAGDCNVTSYEIKKYKFFKEHVIGDWRVSHRLKNLSYKGTTYYPPKKSWSYFDVILFSKNLAPDSNARWEYVTDSIKISNSYKYQYKMEGGTKYPTRFKENGVSDHWPIVVKFKLR